MWPFKKKKTLAEIQAQWKKENPAIPEPKLSIEYRSEKHDIGKTTMLYSFRDGREFYSVRYGEISQHVTEAYVDSLGKRTKPKVSNVNIRHSLSIAQYILLIETGADTRTIVDDDRNPQRSMMGKISSIKIVYTEPYEIDFSAATLVEEK